ncbi:MAG: LysM peptidoglycan-binding domain-containing protein [bacterium]|nr:LysM peptidoglycan-binding domain-containing protein [bacterium]
MKCNLKTLISTITIISFLLPCPAMAKITSKEVPEGTKVEIITIKKGDTLWRLSEIYYKNPEMWKRFQDLNTFTNPHLIFPGEKLFISIEDAQKIKELLRERVLEVKEEIKEVKKKEALEKKPEEPKKEEVKEIIPVKEVESSVPDKVSAKLEEDIKALQEKSKKTITDKQKEIGKLKDELTTLKKEQKMLQESMEELEEKLNREKQETTKLRQGKQEAEDTIDFLAVGVTCGLVLLLNVFK